METHDLSSVTLEYRKECHKEDELQSISRFVDGANNGDTIELEHSLRLASGHEVAKGRTVWKMKKNMHQKS